MQPRLVHGGVETESSKVCKELAARIVVEQDQDRFTARLKPFNQLCEEEKQRLEKPSPPKQS
jgi:hypothetical protein